MAAKKHDFTKAEIAAGALVLVSGAVLVGFIVVIQGLRPEESTKTYVAQFTNTVGLNMGADVRFGGLKVGRVTGIAPDPEDQSQVRVQLTVPPDTPVNEESVASIEQTTLTAEKHLEISTGSKEAAPLSDGAVVRALTKSGGLVELPDVSGAMTKVEDLLDDIMEFLGVDEAQEREEQGEEQFAKVSRVSADVRKALDEGTALLDDVRGVIEEQRPNITEITGKVKDIQDSVNEVMDQVNEMLAENREPIHDTLTGVDKSVESVQGILGDAGTIMDGLSGDLDALMASLQSALDNADGLSGNARDFLDRNRPAIEDIVAELRETLRYLREFSRTMAEQPQSVLRGKAAEGRK